ncbi:MAG: hypothetical protein ABIQ95_13665, partial [Bdellovibrionia bacterium]
LSICYNALIPQLREGNVQSTRASEIDFNERCGSHAVVANAVRWDPKTNNCQVYIKNSHGEDAILKSAWYPAKDIFSHTVGITYFGMNKK